MPGALINLNGIGMTFNNRQALIDNMVVIDGNTALVQDDVGMAQELKVRLGADNSVMYRRWIDLNNDGDGDEDEFYKMISADQFLDLTAAGGQNGVLVQYHNEPVIEQNNAPEFVKRNVETIERGHARGFHVGFGVFGVGNPHESLIRIGAFDDMLLAADEDDALVVHEYFIKHPLDPSENGFLCFRIEEWFERIAELRRQGKIVRLKKFIVAEYGRDLGGGQNDGWRGQRWSAAFYASLLIAGMQEYKRLALKYNVEIYVDVFCAGSGFGQRWQSFNVEGEQAIYDALTDWNRNNPMTNTIPAPTQNGVRARLTAVPAGVTYRQIRNQPNINAVDIGDLLVGDEVVYYPQATSGTWVYINPINQVVRPTGREPAVNGWTSTNGVTFTLVTPPITSGLTQEQWDRLDIANRAIKLANQQIDTLLQEVKPSSSDGGF